MLVLILTQLSHIMCSFQVGACIVNEENKIVGIGYNGMPIGCSDDVMPWGRDSDNILETKQLYGLYHLQLFVSFNLIYYLVF